MSYRNEFVPKFLENIKHELNVNLPEREIESTMLWQANKIISKYIIHVISALHDAENKHGI